MVGRREDDDDAAAVEEVAMISRMQQDFKRSDTSRSFTQGWFISDSHSDDEEQEEEEEEEEQQDDEVLAVAGEVAELPMLKQVRTALLRVEDQQQKQHLRVTDVSGLTRIQRKAIVDRLLDHGDEANEALLKGIKKRCDKVGIKVPKVEVQFQNLTVSAKCYVGDRALPTLWNVTRNAIEGFLSIVGISPTTKMDLNILSDTTGIIKPSRLTLLLGPPSSGKTTMLLALAGKLDPNLKVDGQITYNGHELGEFVPPKTSAYISQTDLHLGEKTVRETLEFSARCQGVGLKAETLKEILRREKATGVTPNVDIDLFMKATAVDGVPSSLQTDYILKVLGLDKCADTFVGDGMIRGVSGGERKRVTTGELLVGPSRVLLMDEISTGLDSSTTYQIVKTLGHFAHHGEATILMSLLQPAPETFELFDDVLLLSEGQIVYQGPRDHILDFFESCGFKCPERKGAADFLQEVTSRKDQEQYWFDKTKPYKYIAVKQFSEKFQQFHVGKTLKSEMLALFNKKGKDKAALAYSKISVNRTELFRTNLASEILLIKRNSFVYIFRLLQIIVMAFIAETVYLRTLMHQRTIDDANLYLGAMFFSLVLHVFNGYPEVAFIIVRLPVFFKQRDLLLYPAWTFTLPTFLVRLPISLLEAGVWVIMTYYVIGYAPEPSRFFRQILVLFLLHQMSTSLFRFIGALSRSMVKANAGGSLALLVFFMLGGFILHKDQIPKWWMWGYWISPLTYAQNAISINELLAPRWNKPSGINGTSLGKLALISNGYSTEDYWYWIGAGALAVYTIIANVLFTITLSYINPPGRTQAVVSKEMLAEIQSTQESHENEKGVTIQLSSEERNRGGDIQIPSVSSHRTWTVSCAKVDVEAAINAPQRKAILPFDPLTMSFENVNYSVDMPPEMRVLNPIDTRLQLLHNVTGAFRPGVLTALMGVSGAGKTTLMDVLAGRKTGGYIEGDIRISGYPKKQETFARISGYCEQTDIHSPQVTVYESLLFSAWLRLSPDITSEYKLAFVEEIMDLVELDSIRDSLVGLPGATGLSTEQRKRLTIAVELVANPSIIFMDEPTSGLDARAAAIVMRTVRNTVDTGRTVVCTIHQPSIDIFESFDELLLMKQGGHVIYAGPLGQRSAKVIEYFEAIPGVIKIRDDYNPAAWMLDVTSASEEIRVGMDFSHVYENSLLYQQNQAIVKELGKIQPNSKDLSFATQYSQSFFQQIKCCLWKQWWTYWRSPGYNCVRFLYSFVCAVLLGTIFWKLGARRKTEQDLLSVLGALYGASMFMGVSNCSSVQPVVDVERTVFYRERAAGMYSAMPYAIAQVLIEIPYTLVQTLVYGLIVYGLIGFPWRADKVFWFLFVMFFTFLYFTYYGMMAVAISPNHQIAAIIASTFYSFFNLFSGFFIPEPSIPVWWSWYYWICPVAWTVYGAVASQFGDVTDLIELPGRNATQINTYLEEHLGYHHDFLGTVAAVLVGFTVFFALMYAYCIKHLNFQHR